MTCTVAQRQRARAVATALRGLAVYVALQAPGEDPTGHWTLDITV